MLLRSLHQALVALLHIERRFDPFFRRYLDAALQEPLAALTQGLINLGRRREALGLAEETVLPDEEMLTEQIIAEMGRYMRARYAPGHYERAGNTKTHGIVRAEVIIIDDIPGDLRHGIFAKPRSFRSWVRFAGPGPDSPPDIDDVGVLSIAVKMMGVAGPKLLADEKFTQDLMGISTPTFTTPNVRENAKLQVAIGKGLPLFYFINSRDSHILDAVMQGLWARTQTSPLETQYWSCVPFLIGEGQAMKYSFRPRLKTRSRVPRLPLRPSDNYLREAMAATLEGRDVEFDLLVQVQTDSHLMPIENASVRWPDRHSSPVPVASLRIPCQKFDSPTQLAFASSLSFNPWHALPEHRPLGNQNRARQKIYIELSRLRQAMNGTPHVEPTGDEAFD